MQSHVAVLQQILNKACSPHFEMERRCEGRQSQPKRVSETFSYSVANQCSFKSSEENNKNNNTSKNGDEPASEKEHFEVYICAE